MSRITLPENKLWRDISNKNYKKNIWGYSPFCSNLITKESYDWGITRRKWDLNNKYLKKKSKSVGRKYLEALRRISQAYKVGYEISQAEGLHFVAKGLFRSDHLVISQPKADFVACEIGL